MPLRKFEVGGDLSTREEGISKERISTSIEIRSVDRTHERKAFAFL